MARVNIDLAAEFTGKKAFGQADNATKKLTTGVKKLAGAIGIAYGTQAILNYSKVAMKAAAADEQAQKVLASNLKNVGLAYASADAESFIAGMEKQTAILDDKLRPAYAQLAQVTGSVSKTQDLMALAFDVSAGSGVDYASTIDIISQAYVGNTKGLKKLNLGLTQAELKSMSFAQVQDKLRANFAGTGQASLDTYAGKMAKLSVATNNASETIGKSLLDAIIKVSGSNGVDGLISKIDTLAKSFASVVTQVGNAVAALTGTETRKAFSPSYYVSGGKAGGMTVGATGAGNMAMSVQSQDLQVSALAAKKKAEAAAIKRAKDLAAMTKAQTKATQDSLKLAKAKAIFDLKKIEIEAALKGQLSDEDRARLLLMKAIEDENITMIDKYTKALDDAQKKTKELQTLLDGVNATKMNNPFANWDLMSVEDQFKSLNTYLAGFTGNIATAFSTLGDSQKNLFNGFVPLIGAITSVSAGMSDAQLSLEKLREAGKVSMGSTVTATVPTASPTASTGTTVVNNISVSGAIDPNSTADQIARVLTEAANSRGNLYNLGTGSKFTSYAV